MGAVMELMEVGRQNMPFRRLILKLPDAQMPVIEIMTNYAYMIKNEPVTSTLLVYARNFVNYNDNTFLTKKNVLSYNIGKRGKNLVFATQRAANEGRGTERVSCASCLHRSRARAAVSNNVRKVTGDYSCRLAVEVGNEDGW